MNHNRLVAAFLGLAAILAIGCDDPGPAEPTVGGLKITVATTGVTVDLDSNGYTLTIDGGTPLTLSSNAAVTIPALAYGPHLVLLGDLAPNCSVSGTNPRSIDVGRQSATTEPVSFFVTCKPRTGSIQISTVTAGPDADANGYLVNVAGRIGNIETTGTRGFSDIREGSYGVFLTDLAPNCVVIGANPLIVRVSFGVTAVADFSVRCVKAATVVITTSTTGVNLDPDGYLLELRPADKVNPYPRASVPANGTTTLTSLRPGMYELAMSNVNLNCTVRGSSPRTVTINAESATGVTLDISCETPTPLAFVRGTDNNAEIYSVNSNGSGIANLTNSPLADLDPEWSPDGSKIAFASERSGDRDIYVMNANGTSPVRLTNSAGSDSRPAWSPNGERIAFMSRRDGNPEIYIMNADGSNPVRLTNRLGYDGDPTWSPDGARLAFRSDEGGNSGIWIMNADGSGVVRLTTSGFRDREPAWSPDGKTVAFARELSVRDAALFIINVDGSNLARLTENLYLAADPAWSPDGRKIAFGGLDAYDFYYSYDPYLILVALDGIGYTAPWPLGWEISNPAWGRR